MQYGISNNKKNKAFNVNCPTELSGKRNGMEGEYLEMVLWILQIDIQQDLLNWSQLQSTCTVLLKMSDSVCFLSLFFFYISQKVLLAHSFLSMHLHMSIRNLHMDLEQNKIPESIKAIYLVLTSIFSGNCARCICHLYRQLNEEKSVQHNLQFRKLVCKKSDMHVAIIVTIILLWKLGRV